jgi:predicted lipopolysaccharide heptosyltransferase III
MTEPLFQQLPYGSRVLFIRLRNLGEAVLDTANLRALKRFRPDLRITTLVEAIYTDLYEDDPEIEAMALPRSPQNRRSSWRARWNVIAAIRKRKFDAVVNLHGGSTSATLTLLSGAKHRVASRQFRSAFAYNLRIPKATTLDRRGGLHVVERQFAQFRWLGVGGVEAALPTSLTIAPRFREAAPARLREVGIDPERPYAVLAPTNDFYTKRWAAEGFAAVADLLLLRGYQVVLSGAPTDDQRAQLAQVQAATAHRLPCLSALTIGELVAVIAGAALFVGNDSGPAHIAAAVKTPHAVLFGPADSVRWGPWRAPSVLVQNDFPCNPCDMHRCRAFDQPECIRSITVDQVIAAIGQLTGRNERDREEPPTGPAIREDDHDRIRAAS